MSGEQQAGALAGALAAHPCRQLCAWRPTRATRDGRAVFACRGCGSQWDDAEPWAPVDADGSRHPALRAALRRARR